MARLFTGSGGYVVAYCEQRPDGPDEGAAADATPTRVLAGGVS